MIRAAGNPAVSVLKKGDDRMPYIEAEALQQARRVDLLSWLQANEPWNLVHISGNNYCIIS